MTKVSAMNQMPNAGMTVQAANLKTESLSQDFGKIMSQERNKVQQPKQTDKTADNVKKLQKETRNTTDKNNIDRTQAKENQKQEIKETNTDKGLDEKEIQNSIDKLEVNNSDAEDIENAVENGIMNILEQMQELLNASSEDLLQAMEDLGLQPIDLLCSDNISKLLLAVAGEDSQMGFVTDEKLYDTLQEMTQIVENQNEAVQQQTGLSAEELEAVMEKIKILEEQQAIQEVNPNEKLVQSGDALEADENLGIKDLIISQESAKQQENIVPVTLQSKEEIREALPTENETEQIQQINSENLETEKSTKGENQQEPTFGGEQNQFLANQSLTDNVQGQINTESQEGFATDLPSTESILKQIADYVKIQKGNELTEMELQLHPASLGNVKVQLATRGGSVTAQFTAETETVKNAIESQVVQLKENLQEQGIKVDAVEVLVSSHQMERNLDKEGKGQKDSEENNKTNKLQRLRRVSINLNQLEENETLEDLDTTDEAAMIAMDMMKRNGSSMDLLA